MPTNRDLLLAHEYFYHVTELVRVESIFREGLLPAHDDPEMYGRYYDGKLPVFLCTKQHIKVTVEMLLRSKFSAVAVLRIPGRILAELQCEVDFTAPDLTEGLSFEECLAQVGFVACLSRIAPEHIERVSGCE